uniref:Uncharacterized protein n=1 Tax=Rhizophora mucronata TaxID=61149 RepID=A0A2P2NJY6_RHIMU
MQASSFCHHEDYLQGFLLVGSHKPREDCCPHNRTPKVKLHSCDVTW